MLHLTREDRTETRITAQIGALRIIASKHALTRWYAWTHRIGDPHVYVLGEGWGADEHEAIAAALRGAAELRDAITAALESVEGAELLTSRAGQ